MFPDWAEQSGGMNQFALWTALAAEGLGANLQHYNPIVDAQVQEAWNVPEDWQLRAQLVFGGIKSGPYDKSYKPIEGERLFVHGA
jgi:predicted oxidoreductase (fatty acid repression mutant protein)